VRHLEAERGERVEARSPRDGHLDHAVLGRRRGGTQQQER
jgi:hypothetical protein